MKLKKLIFPIVVLTLSFYAISPALADCKTYPESVTPSCVSSNLIEEQARQQSYAQAQADEESAAAQRAIQNALKNGYTPPIAPPAPPANIPADGRLIPSLINKVLPTPEPTFSPIAIEKTTTVVNLPVVQDNTVSVSVPSQSIPVVLPDNSSTTASTVIATEPTGFAVTHTPTPTPVGFLLPDFLSSIPQNITTPFLLPSTKKIVKAKKVKTSKK